MNEAQENKVEYLRIDDIIPNRFQPREMFDETGLQELADSIKEHGVIQPIIVRKIGDKYELIAGERRTKASALAGLTTIPAIIRDMDDRESAKVSLLENLQRKNLSAIEEARTYKRILELDNMTQEDLARTMGRSQPMVANKLRLLSLPEEVQDALMKNQISERHARSLLTLPSKKDQLLFLDKIRTERLTVRELDAEIKKFKNRPDEIVETNNMNEERYMNNNRGNFGGMGLNDYQSGINNNVFNNIPNNFNNMPNMETSDNNQNNSFPESSIVNDNNNLSNNVNQSSLGSILDSDNRQSDTNENTNTNTNTNLFVSHIREDNLPKVENQFLPNFDNFDQNNQFNNQGNSFNDNSRESQNNISYQPDNYNIPSQNEYNNYNFNGDNNSNQNDLNYNINDNMNQSSYNNSFNNMNDYNMNNLNNNFNNDLNQQYNIGIPNNMNDQNNYNNQFNNYNSNSNDLNYNPLNANQYEPNYNDNINYNIPNQGGLFNQPLNIVEVNNQNMDNDYPISSNESTNLNLDNNQSMETPKINENPFDDAYENILFAKPVPIAVDSETSVDNANTSEPDKEIEIIGETEEPAQNDAKVTNDNQYISLEPTRTITDTMSAILELKKTTDKIKLNNIPIESEEIDYGDVYQITIKIKKTE